MKKQKTIYRFCRYEGVELYARKEIPYEFRLNAALILDELCFNWNKQKVLDELNHSIETRNKDDFIKLSKVYKQFLWE